MEIPVLAEDSGTLTKLAVAEGDVVQEGDLIAVIERAAKGFAPCIADSQRLTVSQAARRQTPVVDRG